MKNISRRVFIKGMAVAAVATAASTVLAGCNLSQNTQEDVENNTPSSNVFDIEKVGKVTVTSLGFATNNDYYGSKGDATAELKFVADLEKSKTVKITKTAPTSASAYSDGDYYVLVNAYYDGNKNDTATISTFTDVSLTEDDVKTGKVVFTGLNVDDYSKLTVKLTLKQFHTNSTEYASTTVSSTEFTYNI